MKRLDRIAGVALLAPFALQPKRGAVKADRVRRIGLLKTAAIGDTVLLAGLVVDLRATFPSAKIVFISGPDNRAAAELLPGPIDEYIVVSPRAPLAAVQSIRAAKLDVIVDLGSWPRFDALLATLSGARLRLGFRTAGQMRHFGFDQWVPHSKLVHERENYAKLFAKLGVEARTEARIRPPGILSTYPEAPYAVLHPWASGELRHVKEWAADRWCSLTAELHARGYTILLSGGPADIRKNSQLASTLESTGATIINIAGRHTLGELADLLARARVVVSVNTGVMHLACLVGARTVSLDGPTSSKRWGPIGPLTRAVASTFSDSGYLNLGFEYAGHRLDCMDGISVEAVLKAVDELTA